LGLSVEPSGNRRLAAFWKRQKNAAIPAIRAAVNFLLTVKSSENRQKLNFWRLSYVKAKFFNFVKKGHLKTRSDNLTREVPGANSRWG
jgi:hypothetical protein